MVIHKVLNNNVVTVFDEQKNELVIMGRGIAFQKKSGDELDQNKIEKIFTLEDKEISTRLKELFSKIPIESVETSEEIIKLAKIKLGKMLHDNIYVSLTDHIHFAMERFQQGLEIKNALLWETKKFYKEEFMIGKEALDIIEKKLGVRLPEDEAGFIALHIVNAELNEEMPNIVNITKIMQEILNIVKYHFNIDYDEESLHYYRFVTHLKYFAQRLLSGANIESNDDTLYEMVKERYKESFECAEKVKAYVKKTYDRTLSNEDMLYLTIHIERVITK
ncbi:BglG family transcription antiterminator LicT [Halalkalibacter nanhaiisediminis]|uniref:BglG family transcriptional antiterminator n=1 Tax=Halalkalibacter nanhaiisediminis TaxID=688079 RepID=A0A562QCW6_9BACI|nr:PRD domain-containing protein [Halalkalibacter nanhaiisediminis]TWI54549.1 BglG family transcriptional antiterminator [Halalkalibacter nanhaiisediminis]